MDKPVLLEVKDLKTYFYSGKHALKAVDSVSFSIREGEVFGLVGESGSGKSITCKSLIGLIHRPGRIAGGSIRYRGQELAGLSEKALTAVRGREIGMIFQEPMVALNPVLRIGQQITESFKEPGLSGEEKHARAVELLRRVGIPNPEQRMREYPHQFSGGMKQRLGIAQALLNEPEILVLDEPTAGQDIHGVNCLVHIMDTLRSEGKGVIVITHDMEFVARNFERVIVMAHRHIIADGPVHEVFQNDEVLRAAAIQKPQIGQLAASLGHPDILFSEDLVKVLH